MERNFDEKRFRIFASRLNPNVPDPTGVREVIKDRCYKDIFDALRPLPYRVQERLLMQGFGDPRVGMPNGVELALELARTNNIKWFSPIENVPHEFMEEKAELVQKRLVILQLPLKVIYGDWNVARNAAWDASWHGAWYAARNAAWGVNRDAAWFAAGDAAGNAARAGCGAGHAADNAIWDATSNAQWIVANDLMRDQPIYNQGNPFTPLIDMYEKGLWPVGQSEGNFIVFHPQVQQ